MKIGIDSKRIDKVATEELIVVFFIRGEGKTSDEPITGYRAYFTKKGKFIGEVKEAELNNFHIFLD